MLDTLVAAVGGGQADHTRGDRCRAQHARRCRARSRFRRRGGAAAVGQLHRRPDGDGRSRCDLRRARGAAPAISAARSRRDWRAAYDARRRDRLCVLTRAGQGAAAGCKNVALGYLAASGAGDGADARLRAVRGRRQHDRPAGRARPRWPMATAISASPRSTSSTIAIRDNPLVLDKWFSTQALSMRADTPSIGRGTGAACRFHPRQSQPRPLADRRVQRQSAGLPRSSRARLPLRRRQLIALDRLNPQTAAKMLPPLGRWRRFDPARAAQDARRAGAHRRGAKPVEGHVRAGIEKPGGLSAPFPGGEA